MAKEKCADYCYDLELERCSSMQTFLEWCNYHWCFLLFVTLFIGGIFTPIIMVSQPCEMVVGLEYLNVTKTIIVPKEVHLNLQMSVLVDSSASMTNAKWDAMKPAIESFLRSIKGSLKAETQFKISWATFHGPWPHDNFVITGVPGRHPAQIQDLPNTRYDSIRDKHDLNSNLDEVIQQINALPSRGEYVKMGTSYYDAFAECNNQLSTDSDTRTFRLCVVVTDGADMSLNYILNNEFCGSISRGKACYAGGKYGEDPRAIASTLKGKGISIMGILINQVPESEGEKALLDLASCTGIKWDNRDECTFYKNVKDFSTFKSISQGISSKLTTQLESTIQVPLATSIKQIKQITSCEEPLWNLCFLFIIPLLCLFLAKPLARCFEFDKKKNFKTSRSFSSGRTRKFSATKNSPTKKIEG